MPEPKVLAFPTDTSDDVAEKLRELAAEIEAGKYGNVHSVSYVLDLGDGNIEVGLIGNSPLPGPTTHLMLHMGMQKLSKPE